MQKSLAFLAAVAVCAVCCTAYSLYSVSDTGTWPKRWPAELEPLRAHANTFEGPKLPYEHHAIRFTKREEFEAAWPHLLKVKSKGSPVFLVRRTFFLGDRTAGVVVHCPPAGQADNPRRPEAPIPGVQDVRMRWINTSYIDLVVDGEIVDLNRIPLPADTPIIDERFDGQNK